MTESLAGVLLNFQIRFVARLLRFKEAVNNRLFKVIGDKDFEESATSHERTLVPKKVVAFCIALLANGMGLQPQVSAIMAGQPLLPSCDDVANTVPRKMKPGESNSIDSN
jgi:hypothetical protein